jgi:hypothetical protein
MHGALPPLPQYTLMAWCLVKHRDNFTFTFSFTGHLILVVCSKGISSLRLRVQPGSVAHAALYPMANEGS